MNSPEELCVFETIASKLDDGTWIWCPNLNCNGGYFRGELVHPSGLSIMVNGGQNEQSWRLRVTNWPRSTIDNTIFRPNEQGEDAWALKEIGVASTKTPEKIVADLMRRLITGLHPIYTRMRAEADAEDDKNRAIALEENELATAISAIVRKGYGHSPQREICRDIVIPRSNGTTSTVYIRATLHTLGSFNLTLDRLPKEVALRVLALVTALAPQEEAHALVSPDTTT